MNNKIEANYSYSSTHIPRWIVKTDGYHVGKIKEELACNGIDQQGIHQIVQSSSEVLSYCPNPETKENEQSTGIIIGKVQSGKTSNFICLTALAFDNNYKIVVVFGGTKIRLLEQNTERIKNNFKNCSDVLVMSTDKHSDILNYEEITKFVINKKKNVIIVALKQKSHIKKIRDNVFVGDSLIRMATLILDDEGDEASLNTLVKKNKRSAIYNEIANLKSKLKKHSFISITATPQANLLISAIDVLSPDYGVLVQPGNGYSGIDEFHSTNKYVNLIPNDEPSIFEGEFPPSLKLALAMFFVACGIHKLRGMPAKKVSMLIHPSVTKCDHDYVANSVKKQICEWRDYIVDREDIAYLELNALLEKACNIYKNSDCSSLKKLNFSEIENDVADAIFNCKVHIVNSDKNSNNSNSDDFYDYNIYVGGNMLGRGLTIKGLTITYICRTNKGKSNVDTVEQRARWFGYRKNYLDLCRVFAVEKIINEFRSIRDHEEDLWETIEESNLKGVAFKDIARIFMLDGMHATRTNVAQTANYTFKYWNRQRTFLFDQDLFKSNKKMFINFQNSNCKNLEIKKIGVGFPYYVYKDMNYWHVNDQLISKYIFPNNSIFNSSVIIKINKLLTKFNIDPKIDVIFMREGLTSKHYVDSNGKIDNYVVGRRPQDKLKPCIYKGDDKEFKRNNTMQLQIYCIEDKTTTKLSYAIGLYLPKSIINVLSGLVQRV